MFENFKEGGERGMADIPPREKQFFCNNNFYIDFFILDYGVFVKVVYLIYHRIEMSNKRINCEH